jgi:membrane associated rhomboid family serine protease
MGIFAAFAYLFPNTELFIMFIPIPIKAKWAVLGFAAYDLFGGVSNAGDNVAHFAHLGGALTGFIIVLIWNKKNRHRFY